MKHTVHVLLAVLLLTAGCATYPAEPGHEVDFHGVVEQQNSTFRMNGTIEAERGASPDVTVHDVRIVLYDANREQIETVSVGDLSTNSELAPGIVAVNFTTKARPTYVLIESTDIWDKKHVSAEGHKRVDGRFDSYLVYSADEKFAAG